MAYFCTYGEFQDHLTNYYRRTGSKMQFLEACSQLYHKGLLTDQQPAVKYLPDIDRMTDSEFDSITSKLPFYIYSYRLEDGGPIVDEDDLIPPGKDVFTFRHPRYTRRRVHKHDYFEIDYVASGQASFIFENEERLLSAGEHCIIAPNSQHDINITEDATVYTICIRSSTFNTCFFSLLSRNDLLSYFFRTVLQGNNHPNYLLFYTKENQLILNTARHMLVESSRYDMYSNTCIISYINILFSTILRTYSQTVQFYDYKMGTDFTLVLHYIQHNYKNLTLSSLADLFHYSEPHLCTLIRQNTGKTFTSLIRDLRMAEAVNHLENSNMKIGEIAEMVGYNSSDHFSRVFHSVYHMSPVDYRKEHQITS